MFKNVPKTEYTIWFPGLTDPMSIINPSESSSHCFGGLMQLHYNSSKPFKDRLYNNKGVEITWHGNTPETENDSDCGFNAIRNLIHIIFHDKFNVKESSLYRNLE